jgi:hypothetical protein
MKKLASLVLFAVSFGSLAGPSEVNNSNVCSWGILSQFEKSAAAQKHCEGFAGPNGFRTDNPNRANWINACMPIVNQAIAMCDGTDLSCMKKLIGPLKPQVCALNQRFNLR